MSRVADLYIEQHEKLAAKYMEEHPEANEEDAYDNTAKLVDDAIQDHLANQGDYLYEQHKDRQMEQD